MSSSSCFEVQERSNEVRQFACVQLPTRLFVPDLAETAAAGKVIARTYMRIGARGKHELDETLWGPQSSDDALHERDRIGRVVYFCMCYPGFDPIQIE